MSSIVIVNKKQPNPNITYDVKRYCGRGSVLGNEFTFIKNSQFETTQVESRDEACNLMRLRILQYLMDDKNLFPKSAKVRDEFNHLFRLYKQGKNLALECYCQNSDDNGIVDGDRCHTEDIKTIIYTVDNYIQSGKTPKEALEMLKEQWENRG